MDMEVGKSSTGYWNEWQAILMDLFDYRLSAIYRKSSQVESGRQTFSALFLQIKGFASSGPDILPIVIKLITGQAVNDPGYDALAMLGHGFGIVGNIGELRRYLQDVRAALGTEGQVLLTSVDSGTAASPVKRLAGDVQLQSGGLIGPYFNMRCFPVEKLQGQALAAGWQPQIVYRQDDRNYLVQLTISG
jgi:hypothetical protein